MRIEEAKKNLNKRVHFTARDIDADFIFTGCTIRKNEKGFYYQAELQDIKNNHSIMICKLEDVQLLESEVKDES